MKRHLLLVAFMFAWLFWAVSAGAGTYYCSNSTNSTDWNAAQNINTPCSINTTMINAQAGDTTYFRGGTYACPVTASTGYTPAFKPSNSGISGNLITFKAYPDEIPVVDNTANQGGTGTVAGFGVHYQDYIVWDGFHTTGVPDQNSYCKATILYHADNCTIKNCDIAGYGSGVSNNDIIRIEHSNNCTIQNNKLHGSHGSGVNSAAFKIYYSCDLDAHHNNIYDCDNCFFDKHGTYDNKFHHNYVYNCDLGSRLDLICQSDNYTTLIYQNIFRDIHGGGSPAIGVGMDGTNGNGTCTCAHMKFYNNTFYDAVGGCFERDTAQTNTEIYNNITYTSTDALRIYTTSVTEIVDFNVYYNVTRWRKDTYETGAADYASLAAWQAAMSLDMNSITSDPTFVNAGGTDVADYKLQAGSPALTLGVDRQDHDGDGNTTEVIPAGAYITGDELIGYNATSENGNGNGDLSAGSRTSGATITGGH